MKKSIIVVIAKNPLSGKAKTRIAAVCGYAFAVKFSRACMHDLLRNNRETTGIAEFGFFTDSIRDANWFKQNFTNVHVFNFPENFATETFSNKFSYIYDHVFRLGYEKAIIMPMDLPYIDSDILLTGLEMLNKDQFMISHDGAGGVSFVGMNSRVFQADLFNNIRWGCEWTTPDLLQAFGHKKTSLLKSFSDLNTIQDIKNNSSLITTRCLHLTSLLKENSNGIDFPQNPDAEYRDHPGQ